MAKFSDGLEVLVDCEEGVSFVEQWLRSNQSASDVEEVVDGKEGEVVCICSKPTLEIFGEIVPLEDGNDKLPPTATNSLINLAQTTSW